MLYNKAFLLVPVFQIVTKANIFFKKLRNKHDVIMYVVMMTPMT